MRKFLGLPSDKLFRAINRVASDPAAALNAETIDYAHRKGWLSNWERQFYLDTMRKRKLTARQRAKRIEINNTVLYWTRKANHDIPPLRNRTPDGTARVR